MAKKKSKTISLDVSTAHQLGARAAAAKLQAAESPLEVEDCVIRLKGVMHGVPVQATLTVSDSSVRAEATFEVHRLLPVPVGLIKSKVMARLKQILEG